MESSAISLLPGGSGRIGFSEPMCVDTHEIFNGIVVPSLRSTLPGLFAGNRRIVEVISVTSESAPQHQERCNPRQYHGTAVDTYESIELAIPGNPPYSARAIDGSGTILASSAIGDNAAYRQCWLYKAPDDMELIPLPDPIAHDAGGFDSRGFVYLSVGTPGRPQRLAKWDSTELVLLPAVNGYPSAASWISPSGWLAGHVEVSGDVTRADRQQPARWDPNGRLQQADNVRTGMAGTATSIASDGTAIVQLNRDFEPIQSHLWRPEGSMEPLGLPIGGMATGITDEHVVIGFQEVPGGRVAVLSTDLSNWPLLGTPVGWHPTRVAPDGTVAGFSRVDGFWRPWIRQRDGRFMMLPGYQHHDCSVDAIGATGDMVGNAHADHCSHALLWRKLT